MIRRADAVDFTEADWDAVMNLNLRTAFFLCQAFGRHLIETGKPGKIINIASMLSFQGGIRVPSYTASKHGVAGITKLLCNEWAAKGINVNAIAPGLRRHRQHRATARRRRTLDGDPDPHSGGGAGARRRIWAGRRCSSPPRRRTTSTARCCRSTGGWLAR